jgi:pimeloyl-ACP methyl ester carboxylesterase
MASGGNTMNPFFVHQFFLAVSLLVSAIAFAAPTSFTVDVSGKGKSIIFIPGLSSSGEVWKDTVAQFSNRYECHVLTLAGFAGVAPIATPLLSTVQKELVEYIDAKKLDRPIIIGHSLGGFLALRMGADTPAKVGRLIIVDSLPALGAVQMPDVTLEQLKSMAARMRDGMKSQDAAAFAEGQRRSVASMVTKPDDLDRVLGWGKKSDGATVMNAMHDLIATDLRQDIERIKSPTLVLGTWIAYKEYTTRAAVENTFRTQYQKLDGVTIEMADAARHFMMYDDPKWMFERMEKFLK